MAVVWAINCRNTSGYVADVSPEVFEGGTTGWSPALDGSADENAGVDRRLGGIIARINNAPPSAAKSFTIPAAGDYSLRLALGRSGAVGAQEVQYLQVLDNTTLRLTVETGNAVPGFFFDAQGTAWSSAAWPGSNVAVPITFATTTLVVKIGHPTADSSSYTLLAHLSLESMGGDEEEEPDGIAYHLTILRPRGYGQWT